MRAENKETSLRAIGPYLQNPKHDAMTVCLLTREIETASLRWKRVNGGDALVVPATGRSIPGTAWTTWHWRLTGLEPRTEYAYRVAYGPSGASVESQTYRFRTLDREEGVFKAALFFDLHSSTNRLKKFASHLEPDDYEMSFLMGDCWDNPSDINGAQLVFDIMRSYIDTLNAAEKPMVYLRGNHEFRGGFCPRMAWLFDLPNLDPAASRCEQEHQFTLQAGPVWFLAMDCGEDGDRQPELFQPYRELQRDWLSEVLASGEGEQSPWRVYLSHIALYNENIWNSEPSRKCWEELLRGADIDLAMAGHDHELRYLTAGKDYTVCSSYKNAEGVLIENKWTMTPPYPVFMCPQSGFTLLNATPDTLDIRVINASDGSIRFQRTYQAKR
ncbi:MAG: metallophosphoesterase [Kiritimatiellae bacterium]|nr:metallophosphoesterase [Kiritimatiellia bacterium]